MKTIQETLPIPNGQTITISRPDSGFMEAVCRDMVNPRQHPWFPWLNVDVVLDVGANIGVTAAMFASLYPNATVYAIEPSGSAYALLQQNVAAWPTRVVALNIGASNENGQFELHAGAGGSATNSLHSNAMTGAESELVQVRRLSEVLGERGISHISLLKIDTEGCEIPILRDLERLLNNTEVVMVEYHSEVDRVEIGKILDPSFALYAADASFPHRGCLSYVAKRILDRTNVNMIAIHTSSLE